jgi:uncharacterized protein
MSTVKRFMDGLRLDGPRLDENGFLKTSAHATRVGVFVYRRPDGSEFRELRMPEEVFNPDSMSTLEMIPVTNDHPAESLVTPKNAKRLQVGMTGKVYNDQMYVKTDVVITDEKAISEVQNGKEQLSCGYTCELEHTAGVFNGERYDAIQRNIRYNHLAIVARGRAGPQVRLHLDAEDAVEVESSEQKKDQKENEMQQKKFMLGKDEFVMVPEEAYDKLDGFFNKMKADMCKMSEDMAAQKGEKKADESEALQAKVDHLEAKTVELQAKLDAASDVSAKVAEGVKARIALEKVAVKLLKADVKTDEMDDKALKVACIQSVREGFSVEGRSDAYIDAAFELLAEQAPEKKEEKTPAHKTLSKNDSTEVPADKETAAQVRARRMKEDSDAWTKSLGKN